MKRDSTVIAIVSGKGGVGKSVTTVNLAETLRAAGQSTAILDADLGQGACSILLNETPNASLLEVARNEAHVEDAMITTSSGITLLQAVSDPGHLEGYERDLFTELDNLLPRLLSDHAYVLVDAPAGIGDAVSWALDRADIGVLVTVGEPTAIADAYRLGRFVWGKDPAYPLCLLVNFADSETEAMDISRRFNTITQRFTGQQAEFLGWLPYTPLMRASVMEQQPAVREPGVVREAFAAIAETLMCGRTDMPHNAEPITL